MRKAGDIISEIFRERFGSNFFETARSTADVFSSWNEIVAEIWPNAGEQGKDGMPAAASCSSVKSLERGMLIVEADHPGCIQILQTGQASLLSSVQRRYPELDIKGIAFRLSRKPAAAKGSL